MGIKIRDLLPKKEIEFDDLIGKKIGVDFSNAAYQFLASIRQRDGTPLMDSKGHITSHLVGLFTRTANLMSRGIKICYVFDGKPPALKYGTSAGREERKKEAEERLKEAKEEEDVMAIMKYSKQSMRLTQEMVDESKELIKALGLPGIQAPSESDAQLAFMCEKGDIWAAATSDVDPLLHGCPRTITNLTLSQKRRVPGGRIINIKPELIELKELLDNFKINIDQLIVVGILVGTDYNPGGVKGVGPKTALKIVQQTRDFDKIFRDVEADFNWKQVYAIFKSMPIMKNYQMKWGSTDAEAVKNILVDKHDFSEERVNATLAKIIKVKAKDQKGLDKWVR